MANVTYTVKKGDTLSAIASKYNTTVSKLASLNGIKETSKIVVGQTLIVSGTPSTKADTKNTTSSKATIKLFGLQANTDRTMYATWSWDKKYTKGYRTIWYYATGDGLWFIGNDSETSDKQSLYNAPSNATKVKFKVKPISGTHKVNKKDVAYWTSSWSTEKIYEFKNNPPLPPPVPTVTVEKFKLTATIDNIIPEDIHAKYIQFQVLKNDSSVYKTAYGEIKARHVSFSMTVEAGFRYKVRCRSTKDKKTFSEWSDFSGNNTTIPKVPAKITKIKATSATSIYLAWEKVANATTYDIEYTTKRKDYFNGSDKTETITGITFTHYEKSGLESGEEYFFRVRAVNDEGHSGWSEVKSIIIGKPPAPPTTWSSSTTVITGEPLKLYWVHNSEDSSTMRQAEIEIITGGIKDVVKIENKNATDENEQSDKTQTYSIDTLKYAEGTKIQWRVRTAGITGVFGKWSIQRTIDIFAPPTLEMHVLTSEGTYMDTLVSYPFIVTAVPGPNTQKAISYHLTIKSNEYYETVDDIGNKKIVLEDELVYSKHFDIFGELQTTLMPHNVDLENNITYTVNCVVTMDSGLTAEASSDFRVAWKDEIYEPNAEISIDRDRYIANILPYCRDENEQLIEDVLLSVYRREYDGAFTLINQMLPNWGTLFVTDPHPALDFARYRIVATSKTTGGVSYYDVPGYPVGGKEVIIQWDEKWLSFNSYNEDALEEQPWGGSMLKLPYNIDTSDSTRTDSSLVKYIGRKYPVSYYGTQIDTTSTWNVEIPKDDKETLYALRRLSVWMGDVYVREPSGSGYWANISVSFSQKHLEVTIPVTLSITRVVGGGV